MKDRRGPGRPIVRYLCSVMLRAALLSASLWGGSCRVLMFVCFPGDESAREVEDVRWLVVVAF